MTVSELLVNVNKVLVCLLAYFYSQNDSNVRIREIFPNFSGCNILFSIFTDASKFEVEFKSDVNTETTSLPIADMVDMYGNQLLDIQVGQTEMKVRQIFNKFAEV